VGVGVGVGVGEGVEIAVSVGVGLDVGVVACPPQAANETTNIKPRMNRKELSLSILAYLLARAIQSFLLSLFKNYNTSAEYQSLHPPLRAVTFKAHP